MASYGLWNFKLHLLLLHTNDVQVFVVIKHVLIYNQKNIIKLFLSWAKYVAYKFGGVVFSELALVGKQTNKYCTHTF